MCKISQLIKTVLGVITAVIIINGSELIYASEGNPTLLSDDAYDYCIIIGREYGISPELIMAIVERESSGNPKANREGTQKGLMQIYEQYHEDRMEKLRVDDLYDERENLLVGIDYLLELFEQYEDPAVVLMYYNGDSNADDFARGECEMSDYAESILKRAELLQEIKEHPEAKG